MRPILAALALLAAPAAAAQTDAQDAAAARSAAEELADVLAGSFTSAEQAVRPGWGVVESELVRIWPERADGIWLYQENAWLGDSPDAADPEAKARPYFQRLVRLAPVDGATVIRTIYELTEPERAVGAFADPGVLTPDMVGPANCSGPVQRVAEGWWRAEFPTCPSSLRGAVRTHSISIHTPDGFANWDRGFTPEGALAWGPAAGGYVFKRRDAANPGDAP